MAVVRKKQDDKCLEALRDLINTGGGNRQCFDCGQRGPTYVNMTIGSFVCTRCSGVLRGLTPPHRVKSISMATFTLKEIEFLKCHGNDVCAKTWLGLWDSKRALPQDQRELMIDKYERKRYYLEPGSPLKSLTTTTNVKPTVSVASVTSNAVNSNNQLPNNNNSIRGSSNNNNISNNNSSHNNNNNNHPYAQLGPSNTQRTTANGLHKTTTTQQTLNVAISRPQPQHHQNNHHIQQNGFSNNANNSSHIQHMDAFGLNNSSGNSSATTPANTTINGFGSEADFVADFSLANIFNATADTRSPITTSLKTSTTNVYAKVQPLKTANDSFLINHTHTANANTENFADFEHAPIYNAPGISIQTGTKERNILTNDLNNGNVKGGAPSEDRYAALKDLDDQLRESKAVAVSNSNAMENNFSNSRNIHNNNNNNERNPFDNIAQEHINNPFEMSNSANTNTQLYSQMTLIPKGFATTNGFAGIRKSQGNADFFNHTANCFITASSNGCTNDNDCVGGKLYSNALNGFLFSPLSQQIASTDFGLSGNNPFAVTKALNSNNPFL